jgi:hypothetical protein
MSEALMREIAPGWKGTTVEGSADMKHRDSLEVVLEMDAWRLVIDESYPTPLSILHSCPKNNNIQEMRVSCLGNWVSFRQGVCCGCEHPIPDEMLTLGRFTHWKQIYG